MLRIFWTLIVALIGAFVGWTVSGLLSVIVFGIIDIAYPNVVNTFFLNGPGRFIPMPVGIILGAVLGGSLYFTNTKPPACPKCASEYIIVTDSTAYTYESSYTETQRINHYNNDGEERGYSEYEKTVPYEATGYINHMRCNNCSHEW